VTRKYLLQVPVDEVIRFEKEFFEFLDTKYPEVPGSIKDQKIITDEIEETLKKALDEFLAVFLEQA
jgi:F-type H+-transporting ATPase subunit alpha